jgi:drug/metabolite transporter (DMT)-like permease
VESGSTDSTAAPVTALPPSKLALLVAYATLYVVWGSTYLAIRIGVATWPPLLFASVRFAIAGGGLYLVLRARGAPAPGWRAWAAAAIAGGRMLGGGNGTVCWAEQWVPSGETSLILATGPLWTVVLPWLARRAPAPRPLVAAGIAVGLAGVAVLIGSGGGAATAGAGRALLAGRLALVGASLSWCVGSLISHRLPLPRSVALAAAMEMVVASPLLAIAAAAHGDLHGFHFAAITPTAWAALGYLVVFGSLAGFGSYLYLLKHEGPARSSTSAFVNPVIAVALGAAVAGEPIGPRTVAAAAMIIAAVAAVILGTARRSSH